MIAVWYVEAGKYKVLPLDSRATARFAEERPQVSVNRQRYVYYAGTSLVAGNLAPRLLNRPHSITADVEIADGAEGVLVAQGGYSLYVRDRKLHYAYNYLGVEHFHVASGEDVTPGGKALFREGGFSSRVALNRMPRSPRRTYSPLDTRRCRSPHCSPGS